MTVTFNHRFEVDTGNSLVVESKCPPDSGSATSRHIKWCHIGFGPLLYLDCSLQ